MPSATCFASRFSARPRGPTPEADRGIQHFRYALYPHAGTWQQAMTERKGYELNYPLQATVVAAHAGALPSSHSFVSVDDDNVILTAVKKSEDDNALILRVYDWSGKSSNAKFMLPSGATAATEVNLMEQPIGSAIQIENGTATLPVGPFEIRTLRVSYSPSHLNKDGGAVSNRRRHRICPKPRRQPKKPERTFPASPSEPLGVS